MSDLTNLAHEVRLVCQRISRRVRYEGTHDVAPHQFSVLARLIDAPSTPTQIAEIERISTPSVTRTLNGLEREGLVVRTPHPDDGRQVLVSLTDAGQATIARTLLSRDSWMAERLERLDADQLAVLRAGIKVLAEVVAQ